MQSGRRIASFANQGGDVGVGQGDVGDKVTSVQDKETSVQDKETTPIQDKA